MTTTSWKDPPIRLQRPRLEERHRDLQNLPSVSLVDALGRNIHQYASSYALIAVSPLAAGLLLRIRRDAASGLLACWLAATGAFLATGALLATARRVAEVAEDTAPEAPAAPVAEVPPAPAAPVKKVPVKRVTPRPASAAKVAKVAARMPGASAAAIAEKAGVSPSTARRHLAALRVTDASPSAPEPAETPALAAA